MKDKIEKIKRYFGILKTAIKTTVSMLDAANGNLEVIKRIINPTWRMKCTDLDGGTTIYTFWEFCEMLYENGYYWAKS